MILLPSDKQGLRKYFSDKRKFLQKNKKRDLDLDIQSRFLMSRIYRDCDTVLVYISRDHEIDTSGIIRAAAANGKRIAAPVCTDGGEMTFRLIRDAGDLRPGRFGIPQPDDRCPVWRPAKGCVCICPALCCDMRGHRLGFGGGYYDRFLSRFDGIRVGLCYADSIIPALPSESWDIPLDAIFTDSFVRYHHKEEE